MIGFAPSLLPDVNQGQISTKPDTPPPVDFKLSTAAGAPLATPESILIASANGASGEHPVGKPFGHRAFGNDSVVYQQRNAAGDYEVYVHSLRLDRKALAFTSDRPVDFDKDASTSMAPGFMNIPNPFQMKPSPLKAALERTRNALNAEADKADQARAEASGTPMSPTFAGRFAGGVAGAVRTLAQDVTSGVAAQAFGPGPNGMVPMPVTPGALTGLEHGNRLALSTVDFIGKKTSEITEAVAQKFGVPLDSPEARFGAQAMQVALMIEGIFSAVGAINLVRDAGGMRLAVANSAAIAPLRAPNAQQLARTLAWVDEMTPDTYAAMPAQVKDALRQGLNANKTKPGVTAALDKLNDFADGPGPTGTSSAGTGSAGGALVRADVDPADASGGAANGGAVSTLGTRFGQPITQTPKGNGYELLLGDKPFFWSDKPISLSDLQKPGPARDALELQASRQPGSPANPDTAQANQLLNQATGGIGLGPSGSMPGATTGALPGGGTFGFSGDVLARERKLLDSLPRLGGGRPSVVLADRQSAVAQAMADNRTGNGTVSLALNVRSNADGLERWVVYRDLPPDGAAGLTAAIARDPRLTVLNADTALADSGLSAKGLAARAKTARGPDTNGTPAAPTIRVSPDGLISGIPGMPEGVTTRLVKNADGGQDLRLEAKAPDGRPVTATIISSSGPIEELPAGFVETAQLFKQKVASGELKPRAEMAGAPAASVPDTQDSDLGAVFSKLDVLAGTVGPQAVTAPPGRQPLDPNDWNDLVVGMAAADETLPGAAGGEGIDGTGSTADAGDVSTPAGQDPTSGTPTVRDMKNLAEQRRQARRISDEDLGNFFVNRLAGSNITLLNRDNIIGQVPSIAHDAHSHEGWDVRNGPFADGWAGGAAGPGFGSYDQQYFGNRPPDVTLEKWKATQVDRAIMQAGTGSGGYNLTALFQVAPLIPPSAGPGPRNADGSPAPRYYSERGNDGNLIGSLSIDRERGTVSSPQGPLNRDGNVSWPAFELPIPEVEALLGRKIPDGVTRVDFTMAAQGCTLHFGGAPIDREALANVAAMVRFENDTKGTNVIAENTIVGLSGGNPRESGGDKLLMETIGLIGEVEREAGLQPGTLKVIRGETNLDKEIVHRLGGQTGLWENSPEELANLRTFVDAHGQAGMPVIIHCDSGGPAEIDLSQWGGTFAALRMPSNLKNVDRLVELANASPDTTVIWAHAGLGFTVEMPPGYLDTLDQTLRRAPNLAIDLSWDAIHRYIAQDPAGWAKLIAKHPTRFMWGSDTIATSQNPRPNSRKDVADSFQRTGLLTELDKIDPELKEALFSANFETHIHAGAKRVIDFRTDPENAAWLERKGFETGEPAPKIWTRDGSGQYQFIRNPAAQP